MALAASTLHTSEREATMENWSILLLLGLLLLCPISMYLMMRRGGHGGNDHGTRDAEPEDAAELPRTNEGHWRR